MELISWLERAALDFRVCQSHKCHPEGALATEGSTLEISQGRIAKLGGQRVCLVLLLS